ncbi:unnamed protein product, partial [Amoebophrya sp. A25]|eukprot:GSA25T00006108001.1
MHHATAPSATQQHLYSAAPAATTTRSRVKKDHELPSEQRLPRLSPGHRGRRARGTVSNMAMKDLLPHTNLQELRRRIEKSAQLPTNLAFGKLTATDDGSFTTLPPEPAGTVSSLPEGLPTDEEASGDETTLPPGGTEALKQIIDDPAAHAADVVFPHATTSSWTTAELKSFVLRVSAFFADDPILIKSIAASDAALGATACNLAKRIGSKIRVGPKYANKIAEALADVNEVQHETENKIFATFKTSDVSKMLSSPTCPRSNEMSLLAGAVATGSPVEVEEIQALIKQTYGNGRTFRAQCFGKALQTATALAIVKGGVFHSNGPSGAAGGGAQGSASEQAGGKASPDEEE